MNRVALRSVAACVLIVTMTACSDGAGPTTSSPYGETPAERPSRTPTRVPTTESTPEPTPEESTAVDPEDSIFTMTPPDPVSLPALAQTEHDGGGLRLGEVRERTAAYTSYDVRYRSDGLRISGVLNVPTGAGPFPAVVLAHGHIEPAVYVRGQGMTRERGYLAEQGYIALHVDYRNHAESSTDPTSERDVNLGYAVDVINAVKALRGSEDVPVVDDRVALMGRSMGGAVVYNALVVQPGLAQAAVAWASNSTLATEVLRRWGGLNSPAVRAHGSPGSDPVFWEGVSSRTYFDEITEPVLVIQGGRDDTCPPRWARATYRALRDAGVDADLAWYDDEQHAFGARFYEAMDRAIAFFNEQGV